MLAYLQKLKHYVSFVQKVLTPILLGSTSPALLISGNATTFFTLVRP